MKRHSLLTAVVLLIVILLFGAGRAPMLVSRGQSVRFPESRVTREGELWLSWDSSTKLEFVHGFLVGYQQGQRDGCISAVALVRELPILLEEPSVSGAQTACLNGRPMFTKSASHYEEQISAFYSEFPADRDVPLRLLFWHLSDQERRTPAQIRDAITKMSQN